MSRYLLLILLLLYVITTFVWRSYIVWKRIGINPVLFKRSDNAHDFIGQVAKLILIVVAVVVLIYSFVPAAYQYMVPISWLEREWVMWTGHALLTASLLWTILAQAQMGESWRIGIDNTSKTKLVQTGVFRISRNPIYVGIIITLLGLLLAAPNAVTLLVFVLGVVLVNIQTRLEEEYLKTIQGEEYIRYCQRVGRWIRFSTRG